MVNQEQIELIRHIKDTVGKLYDQIDNEANRLLEIEVLLTKIEAVLRDR